MRSLGLLGSRFAANPTYVTGRSEKGAECKAKAEDAQAEPVAPGDQSPACLRTIGNRKSSLKPNSIGTHAASQNELRQAEDNRYR